MSTITITLKEEGGQKVVTVDPGELPVKPGDRVQVKTEGSTGSPLIGVELHVPGNQVRELMHRGQPQGSRRSDVVFERNGSFAFQVGPKVERGRHPYRVYAHFEGSIITVEGQTTHSRPPTMIVE